MKKNVGNGDRFLRIIIGIIALLLVIGNVVEGVWMWVALIVGLSMVITSSVQFCPAYTLFGINTCKVKNKK